MSKHFFVKPQENKKNNYVDSAGIGGRKKLLPGEVLESRMCGISQEVSRGHSSYRKRAAIDMRKAHRSNEGLNVKSFPIQ